MKVFNKNTTIDALPVLNVLDVSVDWYKNYTTQNPVSKQLAEFISIEIIDSNHQPVNLVSQYSRKLSIAIVHNSIQAAAAINTISVPTKLFVYHSIYSRVLYATTLYGARSTFSLGISKSTKPTKPRKNTPKPPYSKCLMAINRLRKYIATNYPAQVLELGAVLQDITSIATNSAHTIEADVIQAVNNYVINFCSIRRAEDYYCNVTKDQIKESLKEVSDEDIKINFGKYSGTVITKLPPDYIDYMSNLARAGGKTPAEAIKNELLDRLSNIKLSHGASALFLNPEYKQKLTTAGEQLLVLFKEYGFTKDMWKSTSVYESSANIKLCIDTLYNESKLPRSFAAIEDLYRTLTSDRSYGAGSIRGTLLSQLQTAANLANNTNIFAKGLFTSPHVKDSLEEAIAIREYRMSVEEVFSPKAAWVVNLQTILMPLFYKVVFKM
jgi:uncharacterized protein (DUF3820 family)